jgi:hypothetical protein
MKTSKRPSKPIQPKIWRPVRKCALCGLPLGDLELSVRETYEGNTEFNHQECWLGRSKKGLAEGLD